MQHGHTRTTRSPTASPARAAVNAGPTMAQTSPTVAPAVSPPGYFMPLASPLYAKLVVGGADEPEERQADAFADKVMRSPDPTLLGAAPPGDGVVRREATDMRSGGFDAPAEVHAVLRSPGHSLDSSARSFLEPRVGGDLGGLRVHTDARAAESAAAVGARAYTVGNHLVFGQGQYQPQTDAGRHLIAHEVGHHANLSATNDTPTLDGALRRKLATEEDTTRPQKEERIEVRQLKYVCIFVGNDLYGTQARRYAKTAMPDHQLIEASTMEGAVLKMREQSRSARKGGVPAHIEEVVLIAHGNPSGFLKVPLISGQKGTTPEALAKLQDEFRAGAHIKFQEARTEIVGLFDQFTKVIVRGCRLGRSQEAVDALGAFFGGQATVYVPKEYQAFTRRSIGSFDSDRRQAAIKAYDQLAHQGMFPKDEAFTDEEKIRWVAAHLPAHLVPEAFFLKDEDVARFRHANADDEGLQAVKDYESSQTVGSESWASSRGAASESDAELDPLNIDEIVKEAETHLRKLHDIEEKEPENWKAVGLEAWWVMRCHRAWQRKPKPASKEPEGLKGDPLAGMYDVMVMPTPTSYDPTLLSMRAARRPDLMTPTEDSFPGAQIALPATATPETEERLDVAEGVPKMKPVRGAGRSPTQEPSENPYDVEPTPAPPSPRRASNKKQADAVVQMPEANISPAPRMPEAPLVLPMPEQPGAVPEFTPVLRGEFKRSFELKTKVTQLGYIKIKKAIVEFNGKIDFKGEGKKEIVFGALGALTSKPGEVAKGAGDKLEGTLYQNKDPKTEVTRKITGGLEMGGQQRTKDKDGTTSSEHGGRTELFVSGQLIWGPITTELKLVFFGIDETKSGTDQLTILGVKFSPLAVTGNFELPVYDGTKVKFSGTIKFTIEAEPDWAKIGKRFTEIVGRRVAVRAGATLVAEATAGAAAAGTAEGAGVAGAAEGAAGGVGMSGALFVGVAAAVSVMAYSYYRNIEDVGDLQELRRASNEGVNDFAGGFLNALGIRVSQKRIGPLWDEGARHGALALRARTRQSLHYMKEHFPRIPVSEDDADFRQEVQDAVLKREASWRAAVGYTYEQALRSYFYRTWAEKAKDRGWARDLNARAYAGLKGLEPNDQPDYSWVNDLAREGGARRREPGR